MNCLQGKCITEVTLRIFIKQYKLEMEYLKRFAEIQMNGRLIMNFDNATIAVPYKAKNVLRIKRPRH